MVSSLRESMLVMMVRAVVVVFVLMALLNTLKRLSFQSIAGALPVTVKGGPSVRGVAILLVVQIKFNRALAETVQETWLLLP